MSERNIPVTPTGYTKCVIEGVTTIKDYILANPQQEVQVCKNVQHGGTDDLRITFLLRQGPYRPKTLGVYVVADFAAALACLAARTKDDDSNINEKGNPLNG